MKHSYTVGCECKRCARECTRRNVQAAANPRPVSRVRRRVSRLSGLNRWA